MRRPAAIVTLFACLTWISANLIPAAQAGNTIRVTTVRDELNNDGDCSLREAVVAANTDAPEDDCRRGDGADRILLQARTYELRIAGANEQGSATGDLDTTGNLSIVGEGPGKTHILGSVAFGDRIFDVTSGRLALRELRIAKGRAPDDTLGDPTQGGGVLKRFGASLMLTRATVTGNRAGGPGGGVAAAPSTVTPAPPPEGATKIRNSKIVENVGAGVVSQSETKIVVTNSSISSNDGAGLVAVDTVRVVLAGSRTSQNSEGGTTVVEANNLRAARVRASGNGAGSGSGSGITAVEVPHATFAHINALNNENYGLVTVESSDIDLEDGTFNGNQQGLVSVDTVGLTLNRVRAGQNEEQGMIFVDVTDVAMSNVTTANNGEDALQVVDGNDVTLRRATSSSNRGFGLLFVDVTQARVLNANVRDNRDTGLLMVDVPQARLNHLRLMDNVTATSSGGGLHLVNAAGPKIKDVVAAGNRSGQNGGGVTIVSTQNLAVRNLRVRDNHARELSGGLELISAIDARLMRSRITGNTTRGSGGGVTLASNTDLLLSNSTIAGNEARGLVSSMGPFPSGSGGGIYLADNEGTRILGSTISGNDAKGHGGGLALQGDGVGPIDTLLVNSTISGNNSGRGDARRGGGLYLDNSFVSLLNNTITRNTSPNGGGIFAHLTPEDPPDGDTTNDPAMIVSGKNTIVAKQRNGGDCRGNGTFDSAGHNLSTSASCFTGNHDRQGNPKLGPLADNGGPTKTHLLRPGSPARDHGANNGCPNRDQRGRRRPATTANRCDIGSVEMGSGGGGAASAAGYGTDNPAGGGGAEACATARSEIIDDRVDATTAVVDEVLNELSGDLRTLLEDLGPPTGSTPSQEGALEELEDTTPLDLARAC